MTAAGIAVLLAAAGFVLAGKISNRGPFSFLHTWQKEVDAIREKYSPDRKGEIIFYGASNFALWTQLDDDLSEYKVQNHAFGGSTDHDLMEYADQILYPYEPEIVFFQTGSNDYVNLSGSDDEKIRKCMEYKKNMFQTFHEKLPDARFVIMSGLLLPGREEYLDMTLKINDELKEYAETEDWLYFVDAEALTYDGAELDKSLFRPDLIHLNHEGELRWCNEYIKPQIEELIAEYGLDELRR